MITSRSGFKSHMCRIFYNTFFCFNTFCLDFLELLARWLKGESDQSPERAVASTQVWATLRFMSQEEEEPGPRRDESLDRLPISRSDTPMARKEDPRNTVMQRF